jgi:NADPH:quinone reductase
VKAGWYRRPGPAEEVIEVGDMETPTAGPGEILVRLRASGINPSDYKRRANAKAPIEFPIVIPHSDGAGVVAALGAGVSGMGVGDRVWVYHAQWRRPFGTAAEFVSLPVGQVKPLPNNASFLEGACFGIPAMTGYHAVHVAGPVAGKTVYVPGATGRVGAYAVQFAKWRGAKVIASTGGDKESRFAVADLGADIVLDRKSPTLEADILQASDGRGVDRIVEVDFSGNIGLDEKILAEHGAIVSFGAASVSSAPISLMTRRARNMFLHFVFVYLLDEETAAAVCAGINEMAETGRLRHRIGGVFALSDLARAHRVAETTSGTGHMVVEI